MVEIVELLLVHQVPLDTDKVVISLVDILDATLLHVGQVGHLQIDMSDELAIAKFIFSLLFIFERVAREHVEAEDFLKIIIS